MSGEPDSAAPIAHLDHDRHRRRGYPEAVYAEHKTPDQLGRIAAELRDRATVAAPALFTRVQPEGVPTILAELPDAAQHPDAAMIIWPPEPQEPQGGPVAVLCAGTSDLPVAREAELTCRHLGRETTLIVDVGVAGLHRVLAQQPLLESVAAIVVVAGMDGALPSVVAGLVSAPVVAVPTSVGYGAAFEGMSALLSMLNSCSPGVAVVNIDNGYGAGHLAAQIARHWPSAG